MADMQKFTKAQTCFGEHVGDGYVEAAVIEVPRDGTFENEDPVITIAQHVGEVDEHGRSDVTAIAEMHLDEAKALLRVLKTAVRYAEDVVDLEEAA